MEKVIVRYGELQSDEQRFESADHEKHQASQHIKNSDALVVDSRKPRESIVCALGRVEHCVSKLRDRSRAIHRSEERYALSWSSCSSVKVKSGINAPGLMCCGLFSQRRMFAGVLSIMPDANC